MRSAVSTMMLLVAVLGTACDSGPTNPFESLPGDVRAFLQADSTLGVRTSTRLELMGTDVAIYRISYGEPLDCPSGCFYARALVLRAGGRVGWTTYIDPAPDSRVFRVQPQDTSSFTPTLLAELRRKDASAYSAVAFMLACSPNTPDSVRERIRRETPTLAPPVYCPKSRLARDQPERTVAAVSAKRRAAGGRRADTRRPSGSARGARALYSAFAAERQVVGATSIQARADCPPKARQTPTRAPLNYATAGYAPR